MLKIYNVQSYKNVKKRGWKVEKWKGNVSQIGVGAFRKKYSISIAF